MESTLDVAITSTSTTIILLLSSRICYAANRLPKHLSHTHPSNTRPKIARELGPPPARYPHDPPVRGDRQQGNAMRRLVWFAFVSMCMFVCEDV
jgi:hypothetical protein